MKEQALRIFELCLQLKGEKGYDIFFSWSPHVDAVYIRHSESIKWGQDIDQHFYDEILYLDKPHFSQVKLDNIIKHLESL